MPLDESGEIIDRLLTAVQDEELSDVAFEALSSMVSDEYLPTRGGLDVPILENQKYFPPPQSQFCEKNSWKRRILVIFDGFVEGLNLHQSFFNWK